MLTTTCSMLLLMFCLWLRLKEHRSEYILHVLEESRSTIVHVHCALNRIPCCWLSKALNLPKEHSKWSVMLPRRFLCLHETTGRNWDALIVRWAREIRQKMLAAILDRELSCSFLRALADGSISSRSLPSWWTTKTTSWRSREDNADNLWKLLAIPGVSPSNYSVMLLNNHPCCGSTAWRIFFVKLGLVGGDTLIRTHAVVLSIGVWNSIVLSCYLHGKPRSFHFSVNLPMFRLEHLVILLPCTLLCIAGTIHSDIAHFTFRTMHNNLITGVCRCIAFPFISPP